MFNLLAIDTSTQACSVALWQAGKIFEIYELKPQQHTQLLLPMITRLLDEAGMGVPQLDALAFACGPGSFTGLRIAAGVIQGIAFAQDLPVITISTLQALAQTCYRTKGWRKVITALDARMNELYWASFVWHETLGMQTSLTEQILAAKDVSQPADADWYGVGDAWQAYGEELKQQLKGKILEIEPWLYPQAQDVAYLASIAFQQGKVVAAEAALPQYLRNDMYKARG